MINDRYLSSFGDSGFFAFSPEKATAGHMDAYFCSANPHYMFKGKKHIVYHYISYLDYRWNRYYIYDNPFLKLTMLIKRLYTFLPKSIIDDECCKFELPIFGGILEYNNIAMNGYIIKYTKDFIQRFDKDKRFSIVKSQCRIANMHKFVLLFANKLIADNFCKQMTEMNIFAYRIYNLPKTKRNIPNCRDLVGRIVEIPMEDNISRMKYLFECIDKFKL